MTEANTIDHDWDRNSDAGGGDDPKSSATPIVWSVNVRDQEVVDMTHADLIERVRGGRLPVTTIIWRDGMDEWQALDHFPEFESLVNESRAGGSGLRAIPDEDEAPTSDNVGGPPTPRRVAPRQIQNTIPGIDDGASRAELGEHDDPLDPLSSFGVLAVYERPVATLEFAPNDALNDADEKPPASDALTPTNPTPLRRRSGPPLPVRGAKEPAKSAGLLRVPALPPLPPRPAPKPAAGRPATEVESLRADEVTAAPPRASSASSSSEVTPALGITSASVGPAPRPAPVTPAEVASSVPVAPAPPADVPAPPAMIGPPRPSVESLPPIIVRELSFASELAATPAPVRHDEATLVLGRRKTHRWVPLRAAIVSAFGSACLASVLTWAIVRPTRSTRAAEAGTTAITATREPSSAADPAPLAAAIAPAAPEAPEEASAAPGTQGGAALPKAEASPEKPAEARAPADAKSRRHSGEIRRAENTTVSPSQASGLEDEERSSAKPAASVAARPGPPLTPRAGWPSNPGF